MRARTYLPLVIIFSAGSMFMASCGEEGRMDGGGWMDGGRKGE